MTVMIHNQPYTTVAERCCLAHADEGFSMLGEEVVEIKDRHFIRVTIDVKGKLYIGSAEIHWNANPKTAEGGNPYETAQTSALGRALGFASYGVVDSVASADEVVRSEQRQPVTRDEALHDLAKPGPARMGKQALTNGDGSEASPRPYTLAEVKGLFLKTYKAEKWSGFVMHVLDVCPPDEDLTPDELSRLHAKLVSIRSERAATATSGK